MLASARPSSLGKAGADLVYAYVFGERVSPFHVTLAPHRDGDALSVGVSDM